MAAETILLALVVFLLLWWMVRQVPRAELPGIHEEKSRRGKPRGDPPPKRERHATPATPTSVLESKKEQKTVRARRPAG